MTEQTFLLDTVVSVTYYRASDHDAVMESLALCRDCELIFSRTDPDSELYRLNTSGRLVVSDELLEVLQTALELCRESGGRFDITMGGVSELYSFSQESPRRPDMQTLHEAVSHVGCDAIDIQDHTVTISDPKTVIDLGSVAKGYIADRMKTLLLSRGVRNAILSLGGNVLTIGSKPDGSPYVIGIQYPEKHSTRLTAAVEVSDLSVVTSGVYERFFEEDGIIYHHLLDPVTGLPLQNGLLAVSIIGPDSIYCDALSTACFAMGPEDGMALIERLPEYEAAFLTEDTVLHGSSGFSALEKKPES